MSVLSVLRPGSVSSIKKALNVGIARSSGEVSSSTTQMFQPFRLLTTSLVRNGGGHDHRVMKIIPSRYQWQKYKDLFHFYVMLGVIPLGALTFYANVFIGPATLTEIPCDYHPKRWEHEKHPVTRFIARYLLTGWQERYERNLFYITEIDDTRRLTLLERRIHEKMGERGDYPNYYLPVKIPLAKYLRSRVLEREDMESTRGSE